MAALRSLMLVFDACQLGSSVEALALLKLMGRGEASGEVGALLDDDDDKEQVGGCVI